MANAIDPDVDEVGRDKRVDLIGHLDDVYAHLVGPRKDGVKARMKEKKLDVVEGAIYDARYVQSESRIVDPEKYFELIAKDKLKRKQFFESVRVINAAADKLVGTNELEKISSFEPQPAKLNVSRKKGLKPDIAASLKAINEALASS
jgi:hypothetical protein